MSRSSPTGQLETSSKARSATVFSNSSKKLCCKTTNVLKPSISTNWMQWSKVGWWNSIAATSKFPWRQTHVHVWHYFNVSIFFFFFFIGMLHMHPEDFEPMTSPSIPLLWKCYLSIGSTFEHLTIIKHI